MHSSSSRSGYPVIVTKRQRHPRRIAQILALIDCLPPFSPKSFQVINVYAAALGFFMPPLRVFCAPLVTLATG